MAINYPINLPNYSNFTSFELRTTNIVGKSRSPYTMKSQLLEYDGGFWSISTQLTLLNRENAEQWNSFLVSLSGIVGSFLIGHPLSILPRGVATGTPRVNGANQTGKSLITDGWTNSITNILKKGDFIQIGNRLYQVLNDSNSDGSGNCTLDIWPRLRESPSDNESIVTISPKGLFRLISNENIIHYCDVTNLYSISFEAEEAI